MPDPKAIKLYQDSLNAYNKSLYYSQGYESFLPSGMKLEMDRIIKTLNVLENLYNSTEDWNLKQKYLEQIDKFYKENKVDEFYKRRNNAFSKIENQLYPALTYANINKYNESDIKKAILSEEYKNWNKYKFKKNIPEWNYQTPNLEFIAPDTSTYPELFVKKAQHEKNVLIETPSRGRGSFVMMPTGQYITTISETVKPYNVSLYGNPNIKPIDYNIIEHYEGGLNVMAPIFKKPVYNPELSNTGSGLNNTMSGFSHIPIILFDDNNKKRLKKYPEFSGTVLMPGQGTGMFMRGQTTPEGYKRFIYPIQTERIEKQYQPLY